MATMDTTTAIYTETSLKKLTVAQLKLICKEKRIVGYSKLAKDNLVQKILGSQAAPNLGPVTATTLTPITKSDNALSSDDSVHSRPHGDCTPGVTERGPTGSLVRSVNESTTSIRTARAVLNSDIRPQETRRNETTLPRTPADGMANSDSLKRLNTAAREPSALKRSRLDAPRPNAIASTTPATLVSKNPPKVFTSDVPASSSAVCDASKLKESRRFKALVPSSGTNSSVRTRSPMQPLHVGQHNSTNSGLLVGNIKKTLTETRLEHLDFDLEQPVLLTTIAFPPSMAQRKHIPSMALILSAISYEDIKVCALVSRAFRYAAYLSASHQLLRKYSGKRLQDVLCRYSSKMTDMWPYLLHREKEAVSRKTIYEKSFLSKALIGIAEVSPHLWHSPDHEKQIIIALRFLTTKLYFLLSTGYGAEECIKSDKPGRILDVQEVVQNEIWRITYSSSTGIQIFHVIDDTCEVIGEYGHSSGLPITSPPHGIRDDWQAYIDEVFARKDTCPDGGLLERLQWANHEEYDKGISKNWLKRTQAEGKVGVAKRRIALRYVLASVVANSISGPWRTANEMAQEFDGHGSVHTKKQGKKLNLFLPMHHHIESVHFTSSNGNALHEALAVVQTPGREYLILRDNGMQVGCEEEGVALIWMKTLGCSRNGLTKN